MRRKRVFIGLLSIFLIFTIAATSILIAAEYEYVGSKKSNKYHYPSCRWAKKIMPNNLVTFQSAKEAQEAGYLPCKVCRPPLKDE